MISSFCAYYKLYFEIAPYNFALSVDLPVPGFPAKIYSGFTLTEIRSIAAFYTFNKADGEHDDRLKSSKRDRRWIELFVALSLVFIHHQYVTITITITITITNQPMQVSFTSVGSKSAI